MGYYFGRTKNKIQNRLTLTNIYYKYIEDKEEDSPYHLDIETYRNIMHTYIKTVMDFLFLESGSFDFPGKIGTFYVCKNKTNIANKARCSLDWNATNKYGKAIYHFNEHSGGFRHKFLWSKVRMAVPNISLYKFVLTRANKRRLAKLIKSGEYDYREQRK